MTLVRLALRLGRVGAIATALVGGTGAIAQPIAYAQLRGTTPADQAVFAQQMEVLGRQLTYLLPVPRDLGTMAGWIEWRAVGFMPIVVAAWALLAATGAGRGDDERGLLEHWLAQGISRASYIATRILAFTVLATAVAAITLGAAGIGTVIAGDPVPAGPLALQAIALLGLVLCSYAIALLTSQLVVTRRAAAALGGGVLLALYLVDVVARGGGAEAVRWISPFWLYDEQHALSGGALDMGKALALYLSAAVLTLLAALAFTARDLGGALVRAPRREPPPTTRPSSDPLLRIPVLALLDQQRGALVAWTIALSALALFFLSFTRTLVDTMLATPSFRLYIERAGLSSYTAFIGEIWFTTLVLLLSIFAIVQAGGWAADDQEGRLEAIASQPVSRSRVVLERLAAALIGGLLVSALSSIALALGARAADIALDGGSVALGTLLTLGVVFAFAGLGAAGVGWRPRATVVILGAVAVASYFLQELAPLFEWPAWATNLSVYALYGNPVSGAVDWARTAALVGIGAVGSVIALGTMAGRDIGA